MNELEKIETDERVKKGRAIITDELDPTNPEDLKKIEEEARIYDKEIIAPLEAEETEKAIKRFDQVIQTEKDMLSYFDDEQMTIKVIYGDDLLEFNVKPIEPGDDMKLLNTDADVLAELSFEEREAIAKQARGEKLTREEEQLTKRLDDVSPTAIANQTLEMANKILAQHLTPPSFNQINKRYKRLKKREEWWSKRPFGLKIFLMNETLNKLGLSPTKTVELFH